MATLPPIVQPFRVDARHYIRTLDAMARHLGALVAELEQIEREEPGPPPERPEETARRVTAHERAEAGDGVLPTGPGFWLNSADCNLLGEQTHLAAGIRYQEHAHWVPAGETATWPSDPDVRNYGLRERST